MASTLNPFASIRTPKSSQEIVSLLEAHAKKGKLPGFEPKGVQGLFRVDAFGMSVDYDLVAHATGDASGTELTFTLVSQRKFHLVMAISIVLTIWPGMWMTDSMLRTWFRSYDFATWMWYVPIMILPLPWLWYSVTLKSRKAASEHAREQLTTIAGCIDGAITYPPQA